MSDLITVSISSLAARLRSGGLSVTEYATALLDRAEARSEIHAWAHIDRAQVLSQAQELDNIPVSQRGPLHGIPIGIKDILLTKDQPTRFNSPFHINSPVTGMDASCVAVLRASGALIMGKTATTEFASTTTGGPCCNPQNTEHTPGGSSSGSAAAVADYHVPLAIGTQTGGSIVRPASFCGIWGFKPTWGLASTEGMSRYSTSCDTIGWLARSLHDLALLYNIYSHQNPSTLYEPRTPPNLKIGMLKTHVWETKALPGLHSAWSTATNLLNAAGYTPVEVSLPSEFTAMTHIHANLMAIESKSMFLDRYIQHLQSQLTDPPGPMVLDHVITNILESGLSLTPQDIKYTYDTVAALRPQWDAFAEEWDVIITPSTTDSAPKGLGWTGDACFNAMWSALHAPCVGVPGLTGSGGLPIGLTVVGGRWRDGEVLRAAGWLGGVLGTKQGR